MHTARVLEGSERAEAHRNTADLWLPLAFTRFRWPQVLLSAVDSLNGALSPPWWASAPWRRIISSPLLGFAKQRPLSLQSLQAQQPGARPGPASAAAEGPRQAGPSLRAAACAPERSSRAELRCRPLSGSPGGENSGGRRAKLRSCGAVSKNVGQLRFMMRAPFIQGYAVHKSRPTEFPLGI